MKNKKQSWIKILSLFLVLLITTGMLPISAFASEPEDTTYTWETGAMENESEESESETSDVPSSDKSETPPQQGDETIPLGSSGSDSSKMLPWALNLHQMAQKPNTFSVNGIGTTAIMWSGGDIEFGGGTYYVGSGYIYRITHSGGDAFCAEFNGNMAGGSYIQQGEGTDTAIRQVIANYEASGKTNSDYIAAQAKIWSVLLGQPVTSWGGSNPNMNIINGTNDPSGVKYFIHKNTNTPHTQNIMTFVKDDPIEPPEEPDDKDKPTAGTVTISKQDSKTGLRLAGAVFEVRVIDGGNLGTYTTDSSGSVKLDVEVPKKGLGLIITEVAPPSGYYLSDNSTQDLFIPYDHPSGSVTFVNDPIVDGEITIYKRDAQTNALLAGGVFEIKEIGGGVLGVHTTDEDGKISLSVTVPREGLGLVITELSPPPGYYLGVDKVQDIFIPYGTTTASVTFVNDPILKSELKILKISETGTSVPNTEFEVRKKDSGISTTVTTGSDGIATLSEIEPDWYTITEKSVPEPYLLDTTPQTIELTQGETHRLTFKNKSKSEVVILKTDEKNIPLAGAVFEVKYKDDGSLIGEFTTDSAGKITLTGVLPEKWITITEQSAPDGYLMSTETKEIQVAENSKTEVHFVNREKPKLIIRKIDEITKVPLANSVFLISYKGGAPIGTFTSDSDGYVKLDGLDPNVWVTVQEVTAPEHYLLNNEVFELFLEAGKVHHIIVPNKPRPTIELYKVDSFTKQPIQFVQYRFERLDEATSSWVDMGTYTTDTGGKITLPDVEFVGRWRVLETKERDGYHPDPAYHEFVVEWGKTTTIELENTPKHPLIIKKIDHDNGTPVEGAVFRIEKINGEFVAEQRTGRNGFISIPKLTPGFYRVFEIEAPAGYLLDETVKTVEVKYDEPAILEFTNKPLGTILINKIDSVTGEPLAGVTIRVQTPDGHFIAQEKTDRYGKITVIGLQPAFYQVLEVQTLPNYLLDETVKTVKVEFGKTTTVEFENKPMGSFLIKKVSEGSDKQPLAGAEFKLTNKNGQYIGTYTTDLNGEVLITNLAPDWYTCVEIKSADGYILDSTPFDFEITWGKTVTHTFVNKPETGIHILKKNKLTSEPMAGISFRITKITGEYVGDFKTDAAGRIYSGKLDAGFYYAQEVETLPNFKLDSAPRLVELKAGEHTSVLYENIEYPTLTLKKTDKEDGKPLAGVQFRLYDEQMREIGTFTTNDLGMIVLKGEDGITEGKYFIKEIKAKDGYVLDETVHEIRLFYGKTTTVNVKNTRNATLRLKKVDKETKKPLYDVEFILMDSKNNVIGVYKTNQEGEIVFPAELKAGKYKLRENKTLSDYVLDEVVRDIVLKEGETTEIVWENQRKQGKIQITKISSANNEITKDKETKGLSGVKFEIYNNKMELVDTITTDAKGLATSKYLPLGVYGIKEVAPADYYVTDGKMFYSELKIHDDLVKFTVKNDPVTLKTTVEKRGNAEVQSGDSMYYEFSNIKNESTVPLEDFYLHDILPTDAIRLEKLWTGTWSERSKMEVQIKTNRKPSYRTVKTGLLSDNNNEIDCSPSALGLASGEYVTEFKIVFKQEVSAQFHNLTNPKIQVKVMDIVQKDKNKLCYQFVNKVDVGGRYLSEWTYATDGWTTTVWCRPKGDLPKTGLDLTGNGN